MKNSPAKTKHLKPRETGIALVTVLVMLVMVATLVSITSLLAIGNQRTSADTVLTAQSRYAAEAGLENAAYQIFYKTKKRWQDSLDGQYKDLNDVNAKFDSCAFKKWLTGKYTSADATNGDLAKEKNNNANCPYPAAGNPGTTDFAGLYNDNVVHTEYTVLNATSLGDDSNVGYQVSVKRQDDSLTGEIALTFKSRGYIKNGATELASSSLEQVLKVNTKTFDGDKFALLTNATNCSMCHLHIDTMQRVYADSTGGQAFERARIAVLKEDVDLDPAHDGDTFIAGTIYGRKNVSNRPTGSTDGGEVFSPKWAIDASSNLLPGMVVAGATSSIRGKAFGDTSGTNAEKAEIIDAKTSAGATTKYAKVYKNYPTEADLTSATWGSTFNGKWPDGAVPDSFPTVITEASTSTDGLISDAEWSTYISKAPKGTISISSNAARANRAVIFGVRRPTSDTTKANVASAPISYDPASLTLNSMTVEGNTSNNVATDFAALAAGTMSDSDFASRWKGWMLQQALASPNNRDLMPVASSDFTWPPANGVAKNNFWVKYYPGSNELGLTFRTPSMFTPSQLTMTEFDATQTTNNRFDCASISSGSATPNCTYVSGNGTALTYEFWYKDNSNNNQTATITSNALVQCSGTRFGVTSYKTSKAHGCRVYVVKNQPSGMVIKSIAPVNASDIIEWKTCAAENSTCSLSGTTVVRYGASGGATYRYKQVTGSIVCSNANFDDPASGIAKDCAIPMLNTQREIKASISSFDLFPSSNNDALAEIQSAGAWDGNLIIDAGTLTSTGTAVQVDGTVSVNGDVVIRGQLMGRGRIVARGNIYIIGDLVYGCGTSLNTAYACKITETDTSKPSYRNSENLPKAALLAGGTVIIGDYDFPDYRGTDDPTNRGGGVYDLVNEQVGRDTGNSSDGIGSIPGGATSAWPYYATPGSTGTNSNNANGAGDMGFVPMLAAAANGKNCTDIGAGTCGKAKTNRYFSSAPFSQIVNRPTWFGSYEKDGGGQLNSIVDSETSPTDGATVIPLYPSNGPILIGASNGTNGFSQTPGSGDIAAGMTCSTGTGATSTVSSVSARRFGGGNVNYNFGFYCPPTSSTNRYLRSWGIGSTDPGQDSGAWMRQSPQNAALDGNRGMSTGWLAGLIRPNSTGVFQQLGDLSQTRLLKLMWLSTMEGSRATMPLRTDGIFYSAHAIFGLSRSFANTFSWSGTASSRSKTEGRWVHNGSVVASELGFLVTGDFTNTTGGVSQRFTVNRNTAMDFSASGATINTGPAMSIYYDTRLAGILQITSGAEVQIQRSRGYAQVKR
jgi:hypothetical protein